MKQANNTTGTISGFTPGGLLFDKSNENAALQSLAPELFQMVKDLKNCIQRLTSDDVLTQYDKDIEAQWIGEAHELLTRIKPNYL